VINLRQIKEIFNQFKILYKNLEFEKEEAVRNKAIAPAATKPAVLTVNDHSADGMKSYVDEKEDGVGDTDGSGFGIGYSTTGPKSVGGLTASANKNTAKKPSQKPLKNLQQVLASAVAPEAKSSPVPEHEEEVHEGLSDLDAPKAAEVIQDATSMLPAISFRERRAGGTPLSRAEEFENFKKERGQPMYRNLTNNKGIFFIV
jgi:kinesin family protein 6/9